MARGHSRPLIFSPPHRPAMTAPPRRRRRAAATAMRLLLVVAAYATLALTMCGALTATATPRATVCDRLVPRDISRAVKSALGQRDILAQLLGDHKYQLLPLGSGVPVRDDARRQAMGAALLDQRYVCPVDERELLDFFRLSEGFTADAVAGAMEAADAASAAISVVDAMMPATEAANDDEEYPGSVATSRQPLPPPPPHSDAAFAYLRLALWGLFDFQGYRALDFFVRDPKSGVIRYEVDARVNRGPDEATQAREDAVARKSVLLPMYSLMVLGQRSIPANVPRVREKIERVVREVVNTRNGILTPFMAVALGEVILELNRAFATLATPYTKFTPGTRIHRAHKNQRKHLVMALRALRQHVDATQDIYRRHGNSFADVTDDEKRDKLAATFIHAAYREYKHVAYVAYFHLLTANIRYVWHDPYHMQGEPKFDPRSSRFMKTMAFYGRLFLKAGRRAFNKSAKDAEIPALAMKRLGSVEDVRGSRARMASWWRQVKSRVHAWWSKVRGKDMHGETSSSRRASMDVVDNRLPWFERKLDLDSYARQYPMDQFPGVFPSEPALRNTRPRSTVEDGNGQVLASSGSDAAAAAAATATVPEQPRQEGDELHELEDDAVSAPPPSEPQAPSTASRHREVFRATVPAGRRAARDGTGSSGDHDA